MRRDDTQVCLSQVDAWRRVYILAFALTSVFNSIFVPAYADDRTTFSSSYAASIPGMPSEAAQIADQLKLVPQFDRMAALKGRVESYQGPTTLESLELRQQLTETKQNIIHTVLHTMLEIDSVMAEISVEKARYDQALRICEARRDTQQARTNAASFGTNGALWAVAEALSIPTYNRPRYSISAGTLGIAAGLVPSAFSLYALREVSGTYKVSEEHPNMLSKMFDYPVTPDIDFPGSIWTYLNTVPADGRFKDTRKNWLINLWRDDKDLKAFKNVKSKRCLDQVTGRVAGPHNVTVDLLTVKLAMLEQLSAMIFRMKKLLLDMVNTVEAQ